MKGLSTHEFAKYAYKTICSTSIIAYVANPCILATCIENKSDGTFHLAAALKQNLGFLAMALHLST